MGAIWEVLRSIGRWQLPPLSLPRGRSPLTSAGQCWTEMTMEMMKEMMKGMMMGTMKEMIKGMVKGMMKEMMKGMMKGMLTSNLGPAKLD